MKPGAYQASLTLSKDELILLNNALNEVCNGIHLDHDGEFRTRLGTTRDRAKATLREIGQLIDSLDALGP